MASIPLAQAGWTGGWFGPWWLIFPLLWIALIGVVIWLVARSRWGCSGRWTDQTTSILSARYARGEIDTDEYRRRLKQLGGPGAYFGPFVDTGHAVSVLGLFMIAFITVTALRLRSRDIGA